MHLAQSALLLKAIKITQIARQAITFGNNVTGGGRGTPNEHNPTVSYRIDKENVVLDPTQTVY